MVKVSFDINESEAKNTFRKFDNGQFKGCDIISKHPNIVKSVIEGKKSWGLWSNIWAEGIVDWSFTKNEILSEFDKHNIVIPESLMVDFDNKILKLKIKRDENLLQKLIKSKNNEKI